MDHITGKKDGKKWVILKVLAPDTGETLEKIIPSDVADKFGLKPEHALSKEQLNEAFGGFEPVEMFFDARGRLEEIRVK